jgi:uncharacterized protein (DUF1015 family)
MARLFPFKGVLPRREIAHEVVSKPFDSYTIRQVESRIKKVPHSFLSIIKPELEQGTRTRPDNPDAQKKSRSKYLDFVSANILETAQNESFYIYRQVKPDFVYTGLIATIAAEDYHNGSIKIHEQTLQKKEEKLKDYLKVVGINAEPVMFTYPHRAEIDELMNILTNSEPYAEFELEDKKHYLWEVPSKEVLSLKSAFDAVERFYVADGHHRSASSVLLAAELARETGDESGRAPWSRFMGIFIPDHNLQLFEFNRLVRNASKPEVSEILNKLSETFEISPIPDDLFQPSCLHEFSMYYRNVWYKLRFKQKENPLTDELLDANILTKFVLAPLFDIQDLRNDDRVGFMSGLKGVAELKRTVDRGEFDFAFGLYPVSMEQFFKFSDEGLMMPPKTTWFEPKLLNGLVIYDIYDGQSRNS